MITRRAATAMSLFLAVLFLSSPSAHAQFLEESVAAATSAEVAVLVELDEPAAAVVYGEELERASSEVSASSSATQRLAAQARAAAAGRGQVQRNKDKQRALKPLLKKAAPKSRDLYEVQRAVNGIALIVDAADIRALRKVPGVRRVTIIENEYPSNSTSVVAIGTPPVWNDSIGLGMNADGTGVRIAVIDTGVDYQHATFGGTGALADYQANDRTVAPDSYFPTTKVVGGYDFAGDGYTGSAATIAADNDPMDCNGHGTHVAGTAAGFGVNADETPFAGPFGPAAPFSSMRIGPGTAPRAQVYAYRVFGCGGSTNLTVQAIDRAVDPNDDNDFSDRVDVINMSLGSSFGSLASTSAVAADNASRAGVMVVASAGNSGDTYFISGSPGSGQRVLATAGTQDAGVGANSLRVNAPAGISGNYAAGPASFGTVPPVAGLTGNVVIGLDPSDAAGPLTTDGCSPLTNAAAIAGNIAMIDRGTCGFAVKVKNAQDAGAIGAIIANSAAGAFGGMGGADPTIVIPSALVTFADGNTFKANIASLNVSLFSGMDQVYLSSSRGPRGRGIPSLKADVAAPGVNITSAQTGITCTGAPGSTGCQVASASGILSDSQPLVLTGTSMAAPHMAGIVALLRQIHPDWTPEQIKAAAMNGAIRDVTLYAGGLGPRFGPGRIGAGRTDPAQSALTKVIAFNDEQEGAVSLSFETNSVVGTASDVKRLRLVNTGNAAATYDLAFDTIADIAGVSFSLPAGNSVTIPANGSVTIDVQLDADSSQMKHSRDATVSATQTAPASPASVASLGALNRHWLSEEAGYLTLSQSGSLKLRVPVYLAAAPASAMSAPDVLATGGAPTGSTTIPLSGTGVCTGTLGAGPTCTGSFPNDEVSLVTPFELQVSSAIDPVNAPGFADIQYAGVAYSAANDQLLFGVSTWEPWSTPTDVSFNIYVDCGTYANGASFAADTCNGVPDGNWDLILFNTNPGSLAALFGASASQQDSFITAVFVRTRSSVVFGPANYVNRLSAGAADSRVFDNQAMFLAVDRTRLKVNSSTGAFRYFLRTCPGTSPLCGQLSGFWYDEAAGPYSWNYLAANQGLDFGGGNLFFDLNGASLPVTWNTANLTANGSLGGLLLHHHNAAGRRAEPFVVDTATATADLAISASVSNPSPAVGSTITLTLTVTNNGPAAASGVEAVVTQFAGLTWVSDDSSGSFNPATGTWTIGPLAASGSATLQIVATVDTSDPSLFRAHVAATQLDLNTMNNTAWLVVQAPRTADVALSMATSSPTVLVGGSVTYTITATNNGGDTAYSLNVGEAFPAFPALNPTTFAASKGTYDPASGSWQIANFASGETATLALNVTAPNFAGTLTNQATASNAVSDPDGANNTASASVSVLSPALIANPTMSVATTGVPGATATYTITLTNTAAFDQQDNPGNEFSVTLPPQVTLVSANAGSGTASAALNTVTWNGSIPAGGTVVITASSTIGGATPLGSVVSAQGTVTFDGDGNGVNETSVLTDDPAAGGATDPTTFTVLSPAVVTNVQKTRTGGTSPGAAVTYVVTFTNTAGTTQYDNTGDEFTDVLPSELVLVSATASSGSATATLATNTVTWNGSIAPGATVTVTINATVSPSATLASTISNQATVNYDVAGNGTNSGSALSDDPSTATAGDATIFTVTSAASVSAVQKTRSGSTVPGGTVTYVTSFTNTAGSAQFDNPGDEFVDVLPSGLTLVSATASTGTATVDIPANTVRWNGTIAAGATVTVTINATVNTLTPGVTIANQATVNFDSDGNGTNDMTVTSDDPSTTAAGDATSFAVTSPATVASATKTVTGATVQGSVLTYTIAFTNTATSTQFDNPGDEFVDVLPAELTLLSANASSGTATVDVATRTVRWNGSIAPDQTITITITAQIGSAVPDGTVITNQGTVFFDANGDGTNESQVVTNPATIAVAAAIPFLDPSALAALVAALAACAFVVLKRA